MLDKRKGEARKAFEEAKKKPKQPSPVSIRLSDEERAKLERAAGDRTLSAYIRFRLFGEEDKQAHPRRPKRKAPEPNADHVMLGQVLGSLGKSRLSSNMNQIAKAAHIGALPVTAELEAELWSACQEISQMREQLMLALGKSSA